MTRGLAVRAQVKVPSGKVEETGVLPRPRPPSAPRPPPGNGWRQDSSLARRLPPPPPPHSPQTAQRGARSFCPVSDGVMRHSRTVLGNASRVTDRNPAVSGKGQVQRAHGRLDPPSGQQGASPAGEPEGAWGSVTQQWRGHPTEGVSRGSGEADLPAVRSEEKLVLGGPRGAWTSATSRRNRDTAPSSSGVLLQKASSTQSPDVTGPGFCGSRRPRQEPSAWDRAEGAGSMPAPTPAAREPQR